MIDAAVPSRIQHIKPFLAMELLEKAMALQKAGREITFMCVGEPDLPVHPAVEEACLKAMRDGKTGYTHSLGILELREAIARHYNARYGVSVPPDRIIVSSGTSPLMLLIFSMLAEKGRNVVLTDPCYACYPNFVSFIEAEARFFPLSADKPGYEGIGRLVDRETAAVIVNSPANPTGTVMESDDLAMIAQLPSNVISDEIYHGLTYGRPENTILQYRDDAFVINGFSKAFCMTGWRLGYAIIPDRWMRLVRSLHQNFLICAPSFIQWAGIAALDHSGEILENMRNVFSKRRDVLLRGLNALGLRYWGDPAGAFYVLVDFRFRKKGSLEMAFEILDRFGVAVTPGIDFGSRAEGYLRLSYATSVENIENSLEKLKKYIESPL